MSARRELAARLGWLLRAQQHSGGVGGLSLARPAAWASASPPSAAIGGGAIPAAAAASSHQQQRTLGSSALARNSDHHHDSSTSRSSPLSWARHHQAAATTASTTPTSRSYAALAATATATATATVTATAASGPLRPHSAAPRPLPRVRRLRDGFTWRRMVVRVPPEVSVELLEEEEGEQDDQGGGGVDGASSSSGRRKKLALTGRAGRLELDLAHLDPTGLVAMQLWQRPSAESEGSTTTGATGGALLLCASPDRRCFRGIATHVDNAVRGVTQGYLQGVSVKGVGYRLEPYFFEGEEGAAPGAVAPPSARRRRLFWEPPPTLEGSSGASSGGGGGGGGGKNARSAGVAAGPTVTYPVTRPATAVRMKVGFKAAAVVPLPPGVRAFFVRPTLAYLYGADRAAVGNAAASLRAVRPPNAYTGNGVQLVGEEIKLRQRAGAK
jgi:ribosomal protein L6P/L9E